MARNLLILSIDPAEENPLITPSFFDRISCGWLAGSFHLGTQRRLEEDGSPFAVILFTLGSLPAYSTLDCSSPSSMLTCCEEIAL